jgi:hypothetical protein
MRWRPTGTKSNYNGGALGEPESDMSDHNSYLRTAPTDEASLSGAETRKKRKRENTETPKKASKKPKTDQIQRPGEDDSKTRLKAAASNGVTDEFMDIDAKVVSPSVSISAKKSKHKDREKHKDSSKKNQAEKSETKERKKDKEKSEKKKREKHEVKSESKEKSEKKQKSKKEKHRVRDTET